MFNLPYLGAGDNQLEKYYDDLHKRYKGKIGYLYWLQQRIGSSD